ncbi:MAG: hypothetical protein ABSE73_15145 [Planctomycetota bacterium]
MVPQQETETGTSTAKGSSEPTRLARLTAMPHHALLWSEAAREHGNLPPGATTLELLGVNYAHLKTSDGGDLYLTSYGLPFWELLLPENWFAKEWFEAKSERLVGTSTVYKVPTRVLHDILLNLVVKWSRVGEEVPLDTLTISKFINAEFNTPFEEFALLTELREGEYGPRELSVRTQRPLAIYVPSERLQLWQTGRSKSKIAAKIAQHPGVELDILRQYVLLYGWIKGLDIVRAAEQQKLSEVERELLLARETERVGDELSQKGFRVIDNKPAHIIVRPRPDGALLRDRRGRIVYALVDYELLERTPEHERTVRSMVRQHYLKHMARRFEGRPRQEFPEHLRPANVMGVDYIFGHAESTGGLLWVVGRDPDLFNFFLPERWRRTPHTKLSAANPVYYTLTKDNIHLVWKVSHLGERPAVRDDEPNAQAILDYGYNSPFEEFAFALELARQGVATVYPRAIYMTGHKAEVPRGLADPRRYETLKHILSPDGVPAVRNDHDYITIWGYWNGPDEALAAQDLYHYRSISAMRACLNNVISEMLLAELLARTRSELAQQHFEDLKLKSDHLLLSIAPDDALVKDAQGRPQTRLCSLELVRRIVTGDV